MVRYTSVLFLSLIFFSGYPAFGKTLVLEGKLDGTIHVTQQMSFAIEKQVDKLSVRFALPAQFSNKAVSQDITGLDLKFEPQPIKIEDEYDRYGNHFKKILWSDLTSDAKVRISFDAHVKSQLSAMESTSPFPLRSLADRERAFLVSSDQVQANDPAILSLASSLTANAATEYEAVSSILNYVSDNIKYTFNPPQYDALYTMETRSGNCQNFAHLSMALLRAVGIPARIVGGISLKQPWKVPVDKSSSLVQSMGQGGHAWMEIYFSDLGWLSYDPQQSKQFTSSRHIKQTHGIDSHDINDSWRGTPYLPAYSELIDAKFLDDTVALKLKSADSVPRAYVISNKLTSTRPVTSPSTTVATLPPQPGRPDKPSTPAVTDKKPDGKQKPKPPTSTTPKKPEKPADNTKEKIVEFGNMEFPTFVDIYQVVGDRGIRILDKETSEYVTSQHVYAQAFIVDQPMTLERVSLAMHKFGGDGTVFIDLVADDNGKPGFKGMRSSPVFVEKITKKPGYYWIDFSFPADDPQTNLKSGKYWIVMRHSGEAILNWFYIPGKPYGGGDDTRSTAKGYMWEDILNYDFVFKVRAKVRKIARK